MTPAPARLAPLLLALLAAVLALAGPAQAYPPYGSPDQPYDRLPGTLETFHVKWARPLSGGRLKVLFILPYHNAREVVELAQRLELDYTVLMCAGANSWAKGYFEGSRPTPLYGAEAEQVLARLTRERLDLARRYDCIIVGKVRWTALPEDARKLVLQHVERGEGLVYVSPSAEGTPADFAALLPAADAPPAAERLTRELPLDLMEQKVVTAAELAALPPPPKNCNRALRQPLTLRTGAYGKGHVVVLDYHDGGQDSDNSLTPTVFYNRVRYDYSYALLARAVLAAAGRGGTAEAALQVEALPCALPVPAADQPVPGPWGPQLPLLTIARRDLPQARVSCSAPGEAKAARLDAMVRNAAGDILRQVSLPGATGTLSLPALPRGNYTVDLRALDAAGGVLTFASRSFRVEDDLRVAQLTTDRDAYQRGQTINGAVSFTRPLSATQNAVARAVDTWGRTVYRAPVRLTADRVGGTFAIPVEQPLSRLWDIYCAITEGPATVDESRLWVGLPNWVFDDYVWTLIFSTHPDNDWKGNLYAQVVRPLGINASNAYLIYAYNWNYELNERAHLQSITYAEHMGQTTDVRLMNVPLDQETSEACLAQFGQMARAYADTGKPLDPQAFPSLFGVHKLGADWINGRVRDYQVLSRFGTPYCFLTGENHLSGEMTRQENSCFCPLCTRNFQDWCKRQYGGSLEALNAEWNSHFTDWSQVRGILLVQAVEQDQLPRWVDFRYFMRSRVYTQFFLDWTDLLRRAVGYDVVTGTNGHDHHDFTRYRTAMTSGKLYVGQETNSEWRTCVKEELQQSFSGDRSFLLAAQSMMMFNTDFENEQERTRWPWKALFAGYRGFDWEQGLGGYYAVLGGMSSVTPDYSEPLPFFRDISKQVLYLQGGLGKLAINAKPLRAPVAILWAPYNHYISRLLPFQENGFSGGVQFNISVDGGAVGDALVLMKSLRLRPTFLGPEDVVAGALEQRGFRALLLPYNKGMSTAEAEALRRFVRGGGLVIADNEPATYSEHGRPLAEGRLADLFPTFGKDTVTPVGQGCAAYLPNGFNGYLGRFERCDYAGSDSVATLLARYAGVTPEIELIDANGLPRRDTLMPVYLQGSARYVGLLRQSLSAGKEVEGTTLRLQAKAHLWDVRQAQYLGYTDHVAFTLDMYPKFLALLPANPTGMKVSVDKPTVPPGQRLTVTGTMAFSGGEETAIKNLGQVAHLEVLNAAGQELECFRTNQLFSGRTLKVVLPLSHSEKPGKYTVKVTYPITGLTAQTSFTVAAAPEVR